MRSSRSSQSSHPPYPYHLTDPGMPTTPTRLTGRGGAGNIHRGPLTTLKPPPSTIPTSSSQPSTRPTPPKPTHTGRGGAGNTTRRIPRIPSEKRLFSFDEELTAQLSRSARPAPIYHVGRGGWANTAKARPDEREHVYTDRRPQLCIDGSARRKSSSETDESMSGVSEKSGGSAPRAILRQFGRTVGKAGDYFVG